MTLTREPQTLIVPACRNRTAHPLDPPPHDEIFHASVLQEAQDAAEHSHSSAFERREPSKEAKAR
ncbi:hypothetical protein ACIP9X_03100 [Arthrobacter sp. NPDC093125]|uniref:hypothetical protein n=1 Tax=Arthrobacter sp. NPDC093125 TaxID=3363944 RepID=UPI0038095231